MTRQCTVRWWYQFNQVRLVFGEVEGIEMQLRTVDQSSAKQLLRESNRHKNKVRAADYDIRPVRHDTRQQTE